MSTFTYRALATAGGPATGEIDADGKAAAASALRSRGLIVLEVDEKHAPVTVEGIFDRYATVKKRELVVFTRQFATMIDAGLSILRALTVLEDQSEKPKLKRTIAKVRADVESGSALSDALNRHPDVFDRLYVEMVRAGEVGGILDIILNRIANQLESDDSLRRQIKSAMTYPTLIGGFALLVLVAMIMFIIPIFASMYADLGGKLPALTAFMITLSDLFRGFWFIVFPAAWGFVYGLKKLAKTEQGTRFRDRLYLRLPMGIGPIVRKVIIARFSRTLGTLVSSGVPILQALDIVGKSSGSTVVEDGMILVKNGVERGEPMTTQLQQVPVFPSMVVQMMAVGEEAGNLDAMLNKIAEFYEDEVASSIKSLTSIIEPIMMIFVGVIVGLVVIAMYLPMFRLFNLIKE